MRLFEGLAKKGVKNGRTKMAGFFTIKALPKSFYRIMCNNTNW
ncbi:unnamed protein product [marine sediment metagenome]|uniref:Uncharacterized protein n=1 Tax=marine sediment metagenome TaxID=412755 RepID=X1PJ27_9ZZZZ